jgi:hypothetical protein
VTLHPLLCVRPAESGVLPFLPRERRRTHCDAGGSALSAPGMNGVVQIWKKCQALAVAVRPTRSRTPAQGAGMEEAAG